MKGLVVFLTLFVAVSFAIFSFSFVAVSMGNEKTESKENSEILEFSTFTSAVCESKEHSVHCRDEVFVNCNGKVSKATDMPECNGFLVEAPKATGFAVFENGWKDPRNQ